LAMNDQHAMTEADQDVSSTGDSAVAGSAGLD
jgi:hypothetical protein